MAQSRTRFSIGLHILAWLLLGFQMLFYVPLSWHVSIPAAFWVWQVVVLLMMIALFYTNARIIVPHTIIRKRPGQFVGWLFAALLLIQLVAYVYRLETGLDSKLRALLGDKRHHSRFPDNFIFLISLLVLGLSTSWALLIHWQRSEKLKQQWQQEKTLAELSMLKAQINPHFFFNSLNAIYALTFLDVEDSRKALHTLSRMMRYLLYNSRDEHTTLAKELAFLKDYISLMRIRSNDKLKIYTELPESLPESYVAPMVLLPFVENAFKHGVDALTETEIDIRLNLSAEKLHLLVINSIVHNNHHPHTDEGGIGLTNTCRRLQLLYPDRHSLQTGINAAGDYEVNLLIDLNA
ncbi:sensor histidine kinase [Rurimicrobium arvi]|uniref:Histidine kinase n=1 Tax=Rurimicrobium arvi TaxID=2049916 RepID=A0ABP8MTU3_9BACT